MTPSTTTVDLNVGYPNIATVVHAVQGDNQSRILTANLYDGGIAWTPPAGAIGVIKFRTPLGTSGMYDTDEEGNTAVTWSGNVATLRIVQNALAVAGDVPMQLSFYDGNGAVLTTFLWETLVQPSVLTDTQFMQTDYYNILSQQIAAIITAVANIPEPSTTTPKMDGTAAVGTEAKYARGDHVHPTDTSRAPTNHASTGTTYGAGNASNYGHVKLSDSTSTTSGTSGGTAATPAAVKAAYDKANAKPDLASTAPQMDGTSAVGTGTTAARADHVHPSDTSRVPTTRKVNNKALSADITLTAEDIGYDDGLSVHAPGSTGKAIADLKGSLNAKKGLSDYQNLNSSDDLNDFYGNSKVGVYWLNQNVVNSPTAYRPLLVLSDGGSTGGFQIIFGHNMLYIRQRTGNPPSWTPWSSINVGMITPYNETGNTIASRSYAINDIFLYGNDLYMAKTNISAGDAITSSNAALIRLGNYINPFMVSGQLTDMLPDDGQAKYAHNTVRKQHNIASIDFRKYGMTPRAGNGVVAKLPEGFRPGLACYCWGLVDVDGGTNAIVQFEIRQNGDIYYYRTSAATTTGYWIVGTYPVA